MIQSIRSSQVCLRIIKVLYELLRKEKEQGCRVLYTTPNWATMEGSVAPNSPRIGRDR
jgi:hypothetical protein